MSVWGAVGNIKGPPGTGGGAEVGGLTPIPNGQAYVDVAFPDAQPDANWILRCQVVNLVDAAPLAISPGTVITKTTTGFRILLSGAPDSANYLLQWGVTEVAAVEATTYALSGPSGGVVQVASTNFVVSLPAGETVPAPVTVTPHDAGGGGTFSPASVVLTSGTPSATFTYTPASVGAKTISTTNNGALTDPASLTYTATAAVATTYTLTGPSSGTVGVPSTNFTVALPVGTSVPGPVTITPHDAGGGGTFTPTTVSLTTAAPSAQFTYTPATVGAKTISTTNSSTLTDPASLTYTASAATATTYTLTGPSSGAVGVASTNFTVALPTGQTLPAPVTITPADGGGGGTFTPTTVSLSTGTPSATFTYTPASTGAKTISTTNSSTLTNPASLTYTVSAVQHLLNALISYWKMDAASGTRNDSQGTNHLTDATSTASTTGIIGNAASFNGTSNELRCANNSTLQVAIGVDFTFQAWVKFSVLGDYFVFSKYDGGTADYYMSYNNASSLGFQFGDLTTVAQVGAAAPLGIWRHVVGWYDHTDQKYRIRINDTTTFVSPATSGRPASTVADLQVGSLGSPSSGFLNGLLDEMGFWKRILTAAEITQLYNGGAGFPFSSFLP
jgi:hypothetical protein